MAQPNSNSRYETIWRQIKEKKTAKLAADKLVHKRIIKAINKRKHIDIGYKAELLNNTPPLVAVLTTKCEASLIVFTLIIKTDFDNIGTGDL